MNTPQEPEPLHDLTKLQGTSEDTQDSIVEDDILSPLLICGFVMMVILTSGISYKINSLLKHPDTPDSVIKETLQAINKGYVSESEMSFFTAKLEEQLKIHKGNTELILQLGDLYRTNFDYRKAYSQYKIVADSKDPNEHVTAMASINGLLVDAFPKSFKNFSKESLSDSIRKDCFNHPEKETPECTRITFSTFCADEKNQRIIKNCQLFKDPSEGTIDSSVVASTSDK